MQGKDFKEEVEGASISFLDTHSLLVTEPEDRNIHWYRYCC